MAMWRHRIAKDDNGELHFVYARYQPEEPDYRCGMTGPMNFGKTVKDMKSIARQLLAACKEPVIEMTERGWEKEPQQDDENGDAD